MREVIYKASGEIHEYLNEIKQICELIRIKTRALDPFCKIKLNDELIKVKRKRNCLFGIFFSIYDFLGF